MGKSKKSESYKEIAIRWMKEGWQKGNPAIVDELHSSNFIDHSSVNREKSCKGFKEGIKELYTAFPNFYAEINDIIIDSLTGKVVIRWTARGKHRGQFYTVAPTYKEIHFTGIEIIRIENGKITDRWGEWNGIELLEQMGGL